jgi:MFS family permease
VLDFAKRRELSSLSPILPCPDVASGGGPFPECIPMRHPTVQLAFLNALIALGGIVGAVVAGPLASRWGRRRILQCFTLPVLISPMVMGLAVNYPMLVVGRFLCGIASGASCAMVPIYLSEISPLVKRGSIGVLSSWAISLGLVLSSLLGYWLSETTTWRWILGSSGITGLAQCVLQCWIVESPVYLTLMGQEQTAYEVYAQLGHDLPSQPTLEIEIQALKPRSASNQKDPAYSFDVEKKSTVGSPGPGLVEFLTSKRYRSVCLILVSQHAAQQLSGVNFLFASAYDILSLILQVEHIKLFYLILTCYCFLLNGIPGYLLERFGRLPLLIASTLTMGWFSLGFYIGVQYQWIAFALFNFVAANTAFMVGLSVIPFIMTSELVLPEVVGVASQVALVVNSTCSVRGPAFTMCLTPSRAQLTLDDLQCS